MATSFSRNSARTPCLAPRFRPLSGEQLRTLGGALSSIFGAPEGVIRGGQWVSMDSRSLAHETVLEAPHFFLGELSVPVAPEKITEEDLVRALGLRGERSPPRPRIHSVGTLATSSTGVSGEA